MDSTTGVPGSISGASFSSPSHPTSRRILKLVGLVIFTSPTVAAHGQWAVSNPGYVYLCINLLTLGFLLIDRCGEGVGFCTAPIRETDVNIGDRISLLHSQYISARLWMLLEMGCHWTAYQSKIKNLSHTPDFHFPLADFELPGKVYVVNVSTLDVIDNWTQHYEYRHPMIVKILIT